MGRPKATLPFGPELMLQRVVRLVREVVEPIVVVAAAGQELPELPQRIQRIRDRRPDRGPLEGLAAGLGALEGRAEAAFVTACDVPLLKPEFIGRLIELSHGYEAAVPHVGGFDEPLAAVYGIEVIGHIETMLAENSLRPASLFDRVRTRRVTAEELASVDPDLESLDNVNTHQQYLAALTKAGFSPPP